VRKLDRLARSLPDARDILDELTKRHVKLSLGGSIHDPTDPVDRLLFNVLAMVEMKVAKANGRLRGKAAEVEAEPGPASARAARPRHLHPSRTR
jgi:DNA invertase Pin-like site-specific DNA recombinase